MTDDRDAGDVNLEGPRPRDHYGRFRDAPWYYVSDDLAEYDADATSRDETIDEIRDILKTVNRHRPADLRTAFGIHILLVEYLLYLHQRAWDRG